MDWYLTDGKSRITREISAVKKPESFMKTRAKISAVRANSFVVVEQFSVFPGYSRAALINFFVPGAALIRGRRLFE